MRKIKVSFLAHCTSSIYTKSNGQCACGFTLPNALTWDQAHSQCNLKQARLPEVFNGEDNSNIFQRKVSIFMVDLKSKEFIGTEVNAKNHSFFKLSFAGAKAFSF